MSKTHVALALAVAVAVPPSPAQERQPPVFPADVELAVVDVTIVDANGAPVRDPRPEDFTLTVKDQPRRVVSAEYLAQGGGEATPSTLAPRSPRRPIEGHAAGR